MAEFVKYPGSPGTWSAEAATLTVTLGEMAQLLLVGGGPPGKERLVLGSDGVSAKGVQEFPWDVPNQRLFVITPERAGDIRLQAWVPNNGPPYTKVVRVVVLPRKPSSLGAENVVLFTQSSAEDKGDELGGVYRRAVQSPVEALVVVAENYAEFVKFLTTFRDTGRRIGKLQVFSHGSPGVVWLGDDRLDTAHVQSLQGKGYNSIFAPNAAVFFSGCNVAEERNGLEFLKAFGKTFLFNGGGSVAASTSLGISFGNHGVFANGKIYHFWGTTKRLYFNTAGKVEKSEGVDDQGDLEFLRG
jgi:Domain of unknown function (DUF4347)